MREKKRAYTIKKKKLMDTTTLFVTLLVAATLVLSSAVTAIDAQDESKEMNNIFRNTNPATLSDPDAAQTVTGPGTNAAQTTQQPTSRDLWDEAFYFDAGQESGSLYLVGIGFDGEYFYCPEFASGSIHEFDIDFNYLGSFTISGVNNIIDLAYNADEQLFYGCPQSPSTTIYVMDMANEELVDTISAPSAGWNIAYDPDADDGNGGLWIGQWSYHIKLIDMSGSEIDSIPVPESALGFAYDNTFEYEGYNGPFLWIFTGTSSYPSTPAVIKCIDIDTKELISDFEHDVTEDYAGGIAGGLELTYDWDSSVSVLMGLCQGVSQDYAFGYEIQDLVPLEHDVGVKSIIIPEDGPATEFITPEVLVKNYGNNSETVDVQFEILKCEAGPPLLYENFSGTTWPPAGWSTDIWDQVNTNNAGGEPPEAEAYKYDYQYPEYYYNYIMAPPVNATGFEKVNVMFHFAVDVYYDNYVYLYLKFRRNATSKWYDLSPWDNPIPGDIEATWYEIGCYGWGEDIGSAFQVKLEMTSYYYYYNYVWFDDFTVEGCAGCAEYANLETEVEVPFDGEVTVEFPDWTPSEWHNPDFQDTWEEYPCTAYTILDIDEKAKNDEKRKLVSLYYPWNHDVGTIGVEGPESGPAQTFPLEATIKNVGQYDECCFKTYASVLELGAPELMLTEDFYPYYIFPPAGWTRTNTKWRGYSGNYCGGGGQEAQFYYYPSQTDDFRLYTPPIDTSGYGKISIAFLQYVSHYTTPYTLKVETSQDTISWTTVWEISPTSGIPAELVEIETAANVGATTYVSWTFSGYSWNINWWNIDNVEIGGVVTFDAEFTDQYCIDIIEDGEEYHIEFNDWTPEFLSEEIPGTKEYLIKVETDLLDPPDNNLANDAFTIEVELDFFHDVGIQMIESPAIDRGDMVWDNGDTDGSNGYSLLGNPRRSLLDDFELEKTSKLNEFRCYMLWTSTHATDWELTFWTDDGGEPGEEIVTATSVSFSEEATGRIWFGYAEYEIIYEFEDVGLGAGTYWVEGLSASPSQPNSFWMVHLAPLWGSECWVNYADYGFMPGSGIFGVQADLSFQLWGSAGPGVYIAKGNQDIIAIAENIGTFPETDMTCYAEILEYYTNCSMGTLVYADNITGIDIEEPLGGTETLAFADFNFAIEGPYELILDLEDDSEESNYGNNHVSLIVGVDDQAPTTTVTKDPAVPDGLNDWYISDLEVTLDATDPSIGCDMEGSGVKEIRYWVDGVPGTIPGNHGVFTIHDDGDDILIEYQAIDNVGKLETKKSFTIDMDQTAPVVTLSYEVGAGDPLQGWEMDFTAEATDAMSGMERLEFALNDVLQETIVGPGPIYEWSFVYHGGLKITVKATAFDFAGLSAFAEVEPVVKTKTLIKNNGQGQTQSSNIILQLPRSI